MSMEDKKAMITDLSKGLSIRRKCELLNFSRANLYREISQEAAYNILLMRLLDEEYTRHPCKGVLKMVKYLDDLGHLVNQKRVRRLLRLMGLMAIYPKPKHLSKSHPEHKIYPYLLNGVDISAPNQIWSSDITYVRLRSGFIYLVAIIDWYSRYVLSWRISNSLDASFCIDALQDALLYYGCPEIFNTDQGSQFTSEGFTDILLTNDIKISMDGRGRAFDNIFIERLWRTVKYEEIFLHDYSSIAEAREKLEKYFNYYNYERHHQNLGYKKPAEVYFGEKMPVPLWTSPADQLKPCGTCGQTMDEILTTSMLPTLSPTACQHSLASRPQIRRLNNNKLL
jgi:putative transposase